MHFKFNTSSQMAKCSLMLACLVVFSGLCSVGDSKAITEDIQRLELRSLLSSDEDNWEPNSLFQFFAADGSGIDINEFLIGVIENFKEHMVTGLPDLKIPVLDPFRHGKLVKVDVDDKTVVLHLNLTEIKVEGLSQFVMEHLNVELVNLTLRFNLRIPHIVASGEYGLSGMVVKIIPLRGNGTFWAEALNLTLAASASLEKSEDGKHLQISSDFDTDIDFEKVQGDLENFLGGGRWTETIKKILNDLSKDLFKKFVPLIRGEMNNSLKKVINKRLSKLDITAIMPGASANEYVDEILHNVRKFILKEKYDPMKLPDYQSEFSKEIMFFNMTGEAKLYNGWLKGISTIHRTDNCEVSSNKTTIKVSAHLGLQNLELYYKGHAKFMALGPSIECGGRIEKVAFHFTIIQSNKRGAKPQLEELEIVELSTIWIELTGLGPLTWIMKWMLTGISKLVESFVVDKVTLFMKEYMDQEFQKISFPV